MVMFLYEETSLHDIRPLDLNSVNKRLFKRENMPLGSWSCLLVMFLYEETSVHDIRPLYLNSVNNRLFKREKQNNILFNVTMMNLCFLKNMNSRQLIVTTISGKIYQAARRVGIFLNYWGGSQLVRMEPTVVSMVYSKLGPSSLKYVKDLHVHVVQITW